ncbi:hypothetical protein M427DRAFT_170148 [Gonapodya prolifera JEL478]|uniref:Uncharacterized protein n=1 Tax=Gonapodya prolifera (strain JEL478) TaxID=1344416 RepID=A0A139B009_GONPJ|nr:hypothetical protein M427DRAFT_170148 [Gonapodya prolifera JEL478]|eukprot:KXS22332.1 hypothetical protein M427DRAFT_170148 [Gonapodya prolifera JEL478]
MCAENVGVPAEASARGEDDGPNTPHRREGKPVASAHSVPKFDFDAMNAELESLLSTLNNSTVGPSSHPSTSSGTTFPVLEVIPANTDHVEISSPRTPSLSGTQAHSPTVITTAMTESPVSSLFLLCQKKAVSPSFEEIASLDPRVPSFRQRVVTLVPSRRQERDPGMCRVAIRNYQGGLSVVRMEALQNARKGSYSGACAGENKIKTIGRGHKIVTSFLKVQTALYHFLFVRRITEYDGTFDNDLF